MGVLVDTNTNWNTPSPPKKKWMMHYLEELPSTEHKPAPCYINGVNGGSNNLPSSVITPLSPVPALYPAHTPHSQPTTTTIINTTHLTTNHITFTNGLLHQTRPLLRKEEIFLTNGTHYVESVANVTQAAPITHSTMLHRTPFPLHCDEEMDQDKEDGRLMTHHVGSYTSSSSSSLAGSVISTSPNSLQSTSSEMIKKRTGISGIREVHNKLEKNRRAHLKECFEILKRQVPPAQEEKKSSNLSILHSAIRYIQFLRRREREFEHEMERLAREKIHAQQRLALLKKELSARWEHIDFNTLIPDNMEVDIPYDNQPRESSLLSYGKERSYMDEEGGLVIVTNGCVDSRVVNEEVRSPGSSCEQGERGESWRGEFVRGGEESWRGDMMYSSSSSLSSTMSPLHNHSTSQTHIQVVTSSPATSSPLPVHLLSSSNLRLLPVSPADNSQPIALTIHTPHHNGGLKSSPPHHLSPSAASLSPHPSPPTSVIVSDPSGTAKYGPETNGTSSVYETTAIGRYGPDINSAKFSVEVPSQRNIPDVRYIVENHAPSGSYTLSGQHTSSGKYIPSSAAFTSVAGVIQSTVSGPSVNTTHGKQMNGVLSGAKIIKSSENIGIYGTPKLVSLSSLPPGLISSQHNTQVLFTQHHKIMPSTGAAAPLHIKSIPSLPALQPISSPSTPQHIILKPAGAMPARLIVPRTPRLAHK